MGNVKQMRAERREGGKGKPRPSLLERAMAELTPGQALRAIFLAAQRLNWKVILPIPPGHETVNPNDLVVGMLLGRENYTAHVLQTIGTAAHGEAYRRAASPPDKESA